jgi:hypothetical protein
MNTQQKDEALRIEVRQSILEADFSGNDIDASVEIERRAHDGTLWTSYLTLQAEVLGSYCPGDREEPPSYPEVQIVSVEDDEKLGAQFELTDREQDNINALLYEEYDTFWSNYVDGQWHAAYDEED